MSKAENSFFKGSDINKDATFSIIQPPEVIPEETPYYNLPSSPATQMINSVLTSNNENITLLPERIQKVRRGKANMVIQNSKNKNQPQTKLTLSTNTLEIILQFSSKKGNTPSKKIWTLLLIEANHQNLMKGQSTISFPLQKLVDLKLYRTIQSARVGFKAAMETLTSLKVQGRDKTHNIDSLRVLITGYDIVKGQCTVTVNRDIDWSFLIQYYTLLPKYYFELSNRASDLLFYICYLARQNLRSLEEHGRFNINFRAIQKELFLPNENESNNPSRDIKEAIEAAIVEIEDAQNKSKYDNELEILPVYNNKANIKEFLDNGYLQITLKGKLLSSYEELSEDKTKQIKKAQARNEKIRDKAIAMNLAKKIEKNEQKVE